MDALKSGAIFKFRPPIPLTPGAAKSASTTKSNGNSQTVSTPLKMEVQLTKYTFDQIYRSTPIPHSISIIKSSSPCNSNTYLSNLSYNANLVNNINGSYFNPTNIHSLGIETYSRNTKADFLPSTKEIVQDSKSTESPSIANLFNHNSNNKSILENASLGNIKIIEYLLLL